MIRHLYAFWEPAGSPLILTIYLAQKKGTERLKKLLSSWLPMATGTIENQFPLRWVHACLFREKK